jgi:DhnA family fructose-bisphosphate aldolase class Ia
MEESNWQHLQEMFNSEYDKLFQLVRHKDKEVAEVRKQAELEQATAKAQRNAAEQETQLLKQKLKEQATNFQQEVELLKVKIAALHQADLETVKSLY